MKALKEFFINIFLILLIVGAYLTAAYFDMLSEETNRIISKSQESSSSSSPN